MKQNLDGGLSVRSTPAALETAHRLFSLAPARLELDPGRAASISGRFLATPAHAPAAYAAAVVEAVPKTAKHVPPAYRVQLLGALLVVKPAAPSPAARLRFVRVVQVGPRRLRFTARIQNTGRVHGYPKDLRLLVRDRHGHVVFQAAPRPGVVLPHFSRDYSADLFRLLAPGRYVFSAFGTFGRSHLHRATFFTLTRPNRLRSA